MRSERIGLRFSNKDEDIISWFLMLKENKIEQSFAVKALLKAFFLQETISGGIIKIRHKIKLEPTSIAINETDLNDDISKIKIQGIKLASFTKDIIRLYIHIGDEDKKPDISEFQRIHTKYKLKYLNYILYEKQQKNNLSIESLYEYKNNIIKNQNIKLEDNLTFNISKREFDYTEEVSKSKKIKSKRKNPLLAQI